MHDRTLHTDIFRGGPLSAIRYTPWGGALGCAGAAADGTVRLFDVDTVSWAPGLVVLEMRIDGTVPTAAGFTPDLHQQQLLHLAFAVSVFECPFSSLI